MKNVFKKIAAIVAVATMSIGTCALPVSAATSSEYYKEIGEQVYAKVIKTYEYDEENENLVRCIGKKAFDITSEDFKEFLKNAEKSDDENRFSNGEWYLITYSVLGENDDGNLIISDYYNAELTGFDENNNPIAVATQYCEEEISIGYGVAENLEGGRPGEIKSGFNRWLIKFDENGEPVRYVTYKKYDGEGAGAGVTRTVDLHTGEDIVIKFYNGDFHYEDYLDGKKPYEIIKKGDANLDTFTDIKDVAKYAQHIVKLSEIPNYADIVADMNSDNSVDIKDLMLLKKQLIGE